MNQFLMEGEKETHRVLKETRFPLGERPRDREYWFHPDRWVPAAAWIGSEVQESAVTVLAGAITQAVKDEISALTQGYREDRPDDRAHLVTILGSKVSDEIERSLIISIGQVMAPVINRTGYFYLDSFPRTELLKGPKPYFEEKPGHEGRKLGELRQHELLRHRPGGGHPHSPSRDQSGKVWVDQGARGVPSRKEGGPQNEPLQRNAAVRVERPQQGHGLPLPVIVKRPWLPLGSAGGDGSQRSTARPGLGVHRARAQPPSSIQP